MDTEVRKVPLGVTSAYDLDESLDRVLANSLLSSIAPFNFPAYVSLSVVNQAPHND